MENEKIYNHSYTGHMRHHIVPTTFYQQKNQSYSHSTAHGTGHSTGHSTGTYRSHVSHTHSTHRSNVMNYSSPVSYLPSNPNPMFDYSATQDTDPVKTKKIRVKLICVFPKWKYLCAKTTVEDYHSLFGGVLDNIHGKNHFDSILNSLEKEFNEETSGSVHLNFQKRKFTYRNGEPQIQELSFVYIGTFHEFDTIFTLIYIPKIKNEIIHTWNMEIKKAQETLIRTIFKDLDIHTDQILLINRIFHQKLMRIPCPNYNISRPLFQFICSKLKEYHGFLEKTGVTIMDEEQFFDETFVWEWNTMDHKIVHSKIHDLFIKTGVQVQE